MQITHTPSNDHFARVSSFWASDKLENKEIIVHENCAKVVFVSSIPPRECGIASYTLDLIEAIDRQFDGEVESLVCALECDAEKPLYLVPPFIRLNTDHVESFVLAAQKINQDPQIKIVVIQHEFGFFASQPGGFRQFLNALEKYVIFVFHTVLPQPNDALIEQVVAMAESSSSIIVMTANARNILTREYDIDENKISIIPHGTHLNGPVNLVELKIKLGLVDRQILSTFGLISSIKNIETTLRALPLIASKYPQVLFLILGKTHPAIIKQEGEKYRNSLEQLVVELGITKHVRFVNEYLPIHVLLEYLQLTDIYLFTSKDPNQAVSGTFSYALGSGCAVVSTPIPHALEILNEDNGIIIDFENPEQLSLAVLNLLDDHELRNKLSLVSLQKMAATAWQNSAIAHVNHFNDVMGKFSPLHFRIPQINLQHIKNLTTARGIIQFAKLSIPDENTGYALDDNARALIATCQNYEITRNPNDLRLIITYLNFIETCSQADGTFLNYCDASATFSHQNKIENLDDSNGRAIWALGYAASIHSILPTNANQIVDRVLELALPKIDRIYSTRAMAFIIKGLYFQNKKENLSTLQIFANRLVQMYQHEKSPDWHWFENYMTYGNSVLPEALLHAYQCTKDVRYKKIAIESLEFLISKIFENGKIKIISNQCWLYKDQKSLNTAGGEQPIDVAYAIMALESFYNCTKIERYKTLAIIAFNWFLGANSLSQIVYNSSTGGCYDGLEKSNVNLNQGAESTVSYLLARLAIERLLTEANKKARILAKSKLMSEPSDKKIFV